MNHLRRAHRHLLYGGGGVLLATGIVWAVLHYFGIALGIGEHAVVRINAVLMKVHGGAAMLALVLLGTMLFQHVGIGWSSARNKPSGIVILTLSALLIITGYLLYYAGNEDFRQNASLLHLAVGSAIPVVVVAHAFRLIRQRRRHIAARRASRRARRRVGDNGEHKVGQRFA